MGGDGERVAGVVVEPGDDLGVGAVGEAPVGEVGLPGFVGELGLEADVGRAGSLLGFGCDEPGGEEVAADRGDGHGELVVGREVPRDRVGPGVEALAGELFAQVHDQRDDVRWASGGCGVGASGAGFERGVTLGPVAGQQTRHERLRHPIQAGCLGLGEALDRHRQDHCAPLGHPATLATAGPCRCPESSLADVLNQHTLGHPKFHFAGAPLGTGKVADPSASSSIG